MKKKLWWLMPILLIIVVLIGLGVGALFNFNYNMKFRAEDIPFNFNWGMSKEAVKSMIYHDYGYMPNAEIENSLVYNDLHVDGVDVRAYFFFEDNKLNSIELKMDMDSVNLKKAEKKLKAIYQKDNLVEIISTNDFLGTEDYTYITENALVSISRSDEMILFSVDDRAYYGETVDSLLKESELTGQKVFYIEK